MIRRTTIEIDQELLARAKEALGCNTARATVEEALRRAVDVAEDKRAEKASRQRAYLMSLGALIDVDVLLSEGAWR